MNQMRKRTKERIKGSMTLLMVVILLPTMVFGGVIVDTARINMAKSMVSSSGDLAMNSTLANYDTVLKEVYGLFANSQSQTPEELTSDVLRYFEDTLVSYGAITEEDSDSYVKDLLGDLAVKLFKDGESAASNFMNMDIVDLAVTPVKGSELSETPVLKKQIVEYMKYRAPLQFSMGFFDSLNTFSSIKMQTDVVNAMVKAQESTQEVSEACKKLIKEIRDYDDKFDEFKLLNPYTNKKDTVVYSVEDAQRDYTDALKEYKGKWTANYTDINRLALAFLLKEIKDENFYLYGHTKGLITKNGSKYAVRAGAVSAKVNDSNKQKCLKDTIKTLNSKSLTYNQQAFNKGNALNDEETKVKNVNTAISQFDTYRDKYKEIKSVLVLLEKARICYEDTNAKLSDAKKEKSAAQKEKTNAVNNTNDCEESIVNIINTINRNNKDSDSNIKALDDFLKIEYLINIEPDMGEKLNFYENDVLSDLFGVNYKSYTPGVSGNVFRNMLLTPGLSDSERSFLRTQSGNVDSIYNTVQTIKVYLSNYDSAVNKEKAAQKKVDSYNKLIADYQSMLKNYKSYTDRYKKDNDALKKYVTASGTTVQEMAKNIKTQYNQMITNLEKLKEMSSDISGFVQDAIDAMETYKANVKEWENNNNKNESKNPDSFVDINKSDISAAEQEFDVDSAKILKKKVNQKTTAIENFIKEMKSDAKFTYGGKKISKIDTKSKVISSAKASKNVSEKFYSKTKADDLFKELYVAPTNFFGKAKEGEKGDKANEMPSLYRAKQYLRNGIYGNSSFLAYLNSTFPADKDKVSEEEKKSETEYEQLKGNTPQSDSSNVSKTDSGAAGGINADKFGYTFASISLSDEIKSALPSQNGDAASVDASGETIKTEGKKEKVSGNMSKKTDIVSQMFSGIAGALAAGRDNVYIMEYILGNFSHNTSVQEAIIDGEKVDNYADLLTKLGDSATLTTYKDKAKTLSRYPLNQSNNYMNGAEVEYILYGNKDSITSNVTYAKATIYAIRFVLNSIYAFTNSEIRNATRTLGLSVQAATMGVVPYQVVQIVAQLALAAAEAALDLTQLSSGIKVPVIKTKETWQLSPTGLFNQLKQETVAIVGSTVSSAVAEAIEGVMNQIQNTLTDLANTTADNLVDTKEDLINDLSVATQEKGRELLDVAFADFESKFTTEINTLQYKEYQSRDQAKTEVDKTFDLLGGYVDNFGKEVDIHEDIKGALLGDAKDEIKTWLTQIKAKIKSTIDSAATLDGVGTPIIEAAKTAKETLAEKVNNYVQGVYENISEYLGDVLDKVKGKVLGVVGDTTEKIKENITKETNNILSTYLKDDSTVGGGIPGTNDYKGNTDGKNKKSVANIVKFSYSDYLRLFMFINLCAQGDNILARTADVIQINVSQAGGNSHLLHNKGSAFRMKNAYTYISVEANLKAHMLFLNLDLFKSQLESYGGIVEVNSDGFGLDNFTKIKYKGLYGY